MFNGSLFDVSTAGNSRPNLPRVDSVATYSTVGTQYYEFYGPTLCYLGVQMGV